MRRSFRSCNKRTALQDAIWHTKLRSTWFLSDFFGNGWWKGRWNGELPQNLFLVNVGSNTTTLEECKIVPSTMYETADRLVEEHSVTRGRRIKIDGPDGKRENRRWPTREYYAKWETDARLPRARCTYFSLLPQDEPPPLILSSRRPTKKLAQKERKDFRDWPTFPDRNSRVSRWSLGKISGSSKNEKSSKTRRE